MRFPTYGWFQSGDQTFGAVLCALLFQKSNKKNEPVNIVVVIHDS